MHQQTSDRQTSRPAVAMVTFVQNKGGHGDAWSDDQLVTGPLVSWSAGPLVSWSLVRWSAG
jgi:hypothetical protein